jgi:transposase
MPKPSRWTQEKRYEVVMETIRGKESITAIARKHQVSDGLIHRWRERFFQGGKAALAMDGNDKNRSETRALKAQIEELQQVIGEQSVEIRFLKRISRECT